MRAALLEIDSRALGAPVLDLVDPQATPQWAEFEQSMINEFDPAYVSLKVPLEDLTAGHHFETFGFRLVECQFKTRLALSKRYDPGASAPGFERVVTRSHMEAAAEIAATSIVHDRYSRDVEVPAHFGPQRYRLYVEQSFLREDQDVLRAYDRESGETIGVRTQRRMNEREVIFLLGAMRRDLVNSGLGVVTGYQHFNYLIDAGFKVGYTAFSSINYPVFNIDARLGFRVVAGYAVFRKIYPRMEACWK